MDPNKKGEKDENDNDNDKSRKGMATMRRRRKAPTTMINRKGGGWQREGECRRRQERWRMTPLTFATNEMVEVEALTTTMMMTITRTTRLMMMPKNLNVQNCGSRNRSRLSRHFFWRRCRNYWSYLGSGFTAPEPKLTLKQKIIYTTV